jgi:hypothetical protein
MLSDLLSETSGWTWHFLRDAPFRPREETITESVLAELHRRGRGQVWIHKATTGEEATDGLDWAWALATDAGWVSMLVQAKQIDGKRFGFYRELRKRSALDQAENLIRAAEMAQAVPVYAFYNSQVQPFGRSGSQVHFGACMVHLLQRGTPAEGFPWKEQCSPLGITMAHAEDVRDLVIPPPAQNQHAATVNALAMPWECIVCPAWAEASQPASPIGIAAVAGLMASSGSGAEDESRTPAWIQPQPPQWAQLLMEGLDPASAEDAPSPAYFVVTGQGPDELQ